MRMAQCVSFLSPGRGGLNLGQSGGQRKLPAATPASYVPSQPQCRDAVSFASRMAAGRTAEILVELQNLNLFRFDAVPPNRAAETATVSPQRGLTADLAGTPVYILDTFMRRHVPCADVALVQPCRTVGQYNLGRLQTVPSSDLANPRLDFRVQRVSATSVVLSRSQDSLGCQSFEAVQAAARVVGGALPLQLEDQSPSRQPITPVAASEHARRFPGHKIGIWGSTRAQEPIWVWDVPFPFPLACRPWRCHTCKRLGDRAPDGAQYFPVTPKDILDAWPHLLHHKCAKQKEHWFTARFVLEASLIFYETLNAKQVRRQLASIWSASALASAARLEHRGVAPWALAWQCASMPKSPVP